MKLRIYQKRTLSALARARGAGCRSNVIVGPTGSGKTVIGAHAIVDAKTIWIAHRVELVDQAFNKIAAVLGSERVTRLVDGRPQNQNAQVLVCTIQALLCHDAPWKDARLIVLDEAHHYMAEEWGLVPYNYKLAERLGLTATPERQDGKPLGDLFDELIVAAQPMELVREGFLVRYQVCSPERSLGNDLAMDPVEAWRMLSGGDRTFSYLGRVELAHAQAKAFKRRGFSAECVEHETDKQIRYDVLERLRSGDVRVVTNVYTMTEGIDIPEVRVAMLCRSFRFVGAYLQAVGRVARPDPGKADAMLIDLCGSYQRHGSPLADREYSLTSSEPIRVGKGACGGTGEFNQAVRSKQLYYYELGALPASGPFAVPMASGVSLRGDEMAKRALKRQGRRAAATMRRFEEGRGM